MTISQILILFFAAAIGGTLNAVAGGGSFFSFPALLFVGVPSKIANATSTVALWPGILASAGAYRKELAKQNRALLFLLIGTSLIGGLLGALLLLYTSDALFGQLVPYLLLFATLLFAFSTPITAWLRSRQKEYSGERAQRSIPALVGISAMQLLISVYGGYFGGGVGILMLAALSITGMDDIHMMNALKTVLNACINGAAIVVFVKIGLIYWPQALVMIVGAIAGGYGGAYYARKIKQKWLRIFVIVVGIGLTIFFFWRQL